MHLGVVMTGSLFHASAGLGVLSELEQRGIEPHSVCGLLGGAWPAALYTAGISSEGMMRAAREMARMGERAYGLHPFAGRRLARGEAALGSGRRLERLLVSQAGQRMLALSPRTGVFLCRSVRTGQRVVFSSRALAQEPGAMLGMQVSVSFAARAAMTIPPFLPPVEWMGSALLPLADTAQACRSLLALGAQRVLVVRPHLPPGANADARMLSIMAMEQMDLLPQEARVLHVQVPASPGKTLKTLLPACMEAGSSAAKRELDGIFAQMGMAFCRVIPFRRCGQDRFSLQR